MFAWSNTVISFCYGCRKSTVARLGICPMGGWREPVPTSTPPWLSGAWKTWPSKGQASRLLVRWESRHKPFHSITNGNNSAVPEFHFGFGKMSKVAHTSRAVVYSASHKVENIISLVCIVCCCYGGRMVIWCRCYLIFPSGTTCNPLSNLI